MPVIPASDIDALFELIESATNELHQLKPGHDLLQYAAPVLQTTAWTKKIGDQFLAQFDKNG